MRRAWKIALGGALLDGQTGLGDIFMEFWLNLV
jgi:hypothetical protein